MLSTYPLALRRHGQELDVNDVEWAHVSWCGWLRSSNASWPRVLLPVLLPKMSGQTVGN